MRGGGGGGGAAAAGGDARVAGACTVYDAAVGSLLVLRRRDGEVDVLNLAILPFVGGGGGGGHGQLGEAGAGMGRTGGQQGQFSNYVSFEAASQVSARVCEREGVPCRRCGDTVQQPPPTSAIVTSTPTHPPT